MATLVLTKFLPILRNRIFFLGHNSSRRCMRELIINLPYQISCRPNLYSCASYCESTTIRSDVENKEQTLNRAEGLNKIVEDTFDSIISSGYKVDDPEIVMEKIRSYISLAYKFNVKANYIVKALKNVPEMLLVSIDNFEEVCQTLKNNGLGSHLAIRTIFMYPNILHVSTDKIDTALQQLHDITKLPAHIYVDLVSSTPHIITLPMDHVHSSWTNLLTLFTRRLLVRMVKLNPAILLESWNSLNEKMQYLFWEMGLEQPVIANSQVLTHSLEHIRLRHLFALRAGKFAPPNPKRVDKVVNLSEIMDTTDKYFATRVVKLSLLEYEIFRRIIEIEDLENDE